MIEYFDLMFISESSKKAWNSVENDDNTVLKDMNILLIIKELLRLDENFPTNFIKYPCLNQNDAEYRLDIMQELLLDDDLANETTGLIKLVSDMERKFRQMQETEYKTQKEYIFLNLLILYFEILEKSIEIFSSCKSAGLTAFSGYCRELAGQYGLSTLYNNSLALRHKLRKILNVSISINRQSKMVYVNDPIEDNDTVYLEKYCNDLFSLKLEGLFSIFNDAAYTPLEAKILEIRKSENTAIFDELGNFFGKHITMEKYINDFIGFKDQLIFYTTYVTSSPQ